MNKILILPSQVADQIAAGEVVERLASVVKELLDNAIDARASEVEIRLEDGGISKIEVSDNGEGMEREDLELAVARHGTSKLREIDDLTRIATMGFRGEALASIAAVSRFTLRSKRKDDVAGGELVVEGGKMARKGEAGMAQGTVVVVEDLFFNMPARKKFLRTGTTEWRYCLAMIERLALANVGVGIRLWHNDKLHLNLLEADSFEERVKKVFGNEAEQMFKVQYDHAHWRMSGLVGKPQLGREKGMLQVAIVNGRVVSDRGIVRSVKEALGSLLPPRYQVPWVISIKMPGEMVDVNVHPRKEEVRFVNAYAVYSGIGKMIEDAVRKEDMRFVRGESEEASLRSGTVAVSLPSRNVLSAERPWRNTKEMSNDISWLWKGGNKVPEATKGFVSVQEDLIAAESMADRRRVFQLHNLYIVSEEEQGMVVIDQHAAHERIRYEELMKAAQARVSQSVDMLIPTTIELASGEIEVLGEYRELLDKVGLKFEVSKGKVDILSVPAGWEEVNMGKAIREVAGDLIDEGKTDLMADETSRVLTYLACRGAIKGGQKLTEWEMGRLVDDLHKCALPYTCPHGRPVEIVITWKELEKMFLRVGM